MSARFVVKCAPRQTKQGRPVNPGDGDRVAEAEAGRPIALSVTEPRCRG